MQALMFVNLKKLYLLKNNNKKWNVEFKMFF